MNAKKSLFSLALVLSLLTACSTQEAEQMAAEAQQQASSAEAAVSVVAEASPDATVITLNGNSVDIDGEGARAQGSIVKIEKEGDYQLVGTLEDGQIIVEVDKETNVDLYLGGVNITNTTGAPLYMKEVNNVDIILMEGTENYVTDGAAYDLAEGEDEPDAAIFSKGDLEFKGTGSLTVTGNYDMAIHGKDDVEVKEGTYTLTSVGDGLKGKDSVVISGGTFDIASGGDAIQSNNDTELGYIDISGGDFTIVSQEDGINAIGDVTISGGTFNLDCQKDGIQSDNNLNVSGGDLTLDTQSDGLYAVCDLTVSGGSINIFTAEGSANAPAHVEAFGPGGGFPGPGGFPGWDDTTATADEETESAKGLKASGSITISGGNITIDALDDAIHCAVTATIEEGANLTLSTGDDGIHSDETLIINGGNIDVLTSYEGLEGLYIQVHGGNTSLVASDDGINAAGGTGEEFPMMGPGGPFGGMGTVETIEDATYYVQITGGTLNIDASGDGLDSNGALFVEGGEIYLSGPENSGNGALDYTTTGSVSGGKALITGSSGMAMNFGSSSTQTVVMYRFEDYREGGTVVTVKDGDTEVMTFTPQKMFSSVLITFPEMEVGKEYTLLVGDETLSFTPSDVVSSAGAAGGFGGFGGFGGMGPGRR